MGEIEKREESNVSEISDEKIAELIMNGKKEFYREIVDRYQQKLLRYAVSLCGNKDRAADIVQESFIKAFINLRSFDVTKKLSSWLYRIVHNEAINNLRKYRKEVSLEENEVLFEKLEGDENIVNDAIKKEGAENVRRCMRKLPAKYSGPLALFYLEQKNYEEISEIMRLPVSTIGVRINRAKQMIKKNCIDINTNF